jgi:putative ABC transport system ATP-binding protein
LLRLASLLDLPESGDVYLLRQSTAALDEATRCSLRSRHFGFVFSSPCLLPGLSVAENVAMPLFKIHGLNPNEAGDRLARALEFVGLHSLERDAVDQLVRFDQQRVALARAIAHRPEVLVLDRADLALSGDDASRLLEIVRRSREELGTAVLTTFASHTTADRSDRILAIEDGAVCRDTAYASPAEPHGSSTS